MNFYEIIYQLQSKLYDIGIRVYQENGFPTIFALPLGEELDAAIQRKNLLDTHAFELMNKYKLSKKQMDAFLSLYYGYAQQGDNMDDLEELIQSSDYFDNSKDAFLNMVEDCGHDLIETLYDYKVKPLVKGLTTISEILLYNHEDYYRVGENEYIFYNHDEVLMREERGNEHE